MCIQLGKRIPRLAAAQDGQVLLVCKIAVREKSINYDPLSLKFPSPAMWIELRS